MPPSADPQPRRNRVTPTGELIADAAHGLVYGNRGCLHGADGKVHRRFAGTRWIACRLRVRGRKRRVLMMPGRYTELFFLDEATAMAAGHRACATCRRRDFVRLTEIWGALHPGEESAGAIADRRPRPRGATVEPITPPSLVAVLRAGWSPSVPLLHPSARR